MAKNTEKDIKQRVIFTSRKNISELGGRGKDQDNQVAADDIWTAFYWENVSRKRKNINAERRGGAEAYWESFSRIRKKENSPNWESVSQKIRLVTQEGRGQHSFYLFI